jgi:small redox-active disulfide protein 2
MLTIKVLGSGCENCKKLASLVEQAVATLAIEAQVEKVTDPAQIKSYRLLATPGLVINERVVSAGRIPDEAEITSFLTSALMEADRG